MRTRLRNLSRLAAVAATAFLLLGGAYDLAYAAQVTLPSQDEPVDNLEGVESATVQIEAVGTFADPADGMQRNVPGYGSGFIIAPNGIAVTNNHVVTGGALFRVYVSGRDEPVNARVLGVSECADLAVIDLQGSGYPYLEWYTRPVRVGLDIYAAGFPLGDPEFALTRGIVAKAAADGESSWSSLDSVIMHDAVINPGNSGGPLVTEDGQVVGVNYASNGDTDQSFAIPAAIAIDIVEQLREGADVESLGINGEAFDDGEGFSGIWVYSVASGSPADVAGIKAGDFISEIEGVSVGAGGNMADYCDIVASHDAADVMTIQVLRGDEVLEGQLNGRPLEASFNLAEEVDPGAGSEQAAVEEYAYATIGDEAGVFTLEVPEEWSDVKESDWLLDDEPIGTMLVAASDVQEWYDSYDVPGVRVSFSDSLQDEYTVEELLDSLGLDEDCTYVGRTELPEGGFYTGAVDDYKECAGTDTSAIVAVLTPETKDYIVRIDAYASSPADIAALDHLLDTFYVMAGSAPETVDVGGDIFDIVNVEGLTYDYTFLNEPYFSAIVPADWSDISVADWVDDDDANNVLGKEIFIAPSIEAFTSTWSAPGIQVNLATDLNADFDPIGLLDGTTYAEDCTFDETIPYTHTIYGVTYVGGYEVYSDCGGTGNILYSAVFAEQNRDHGYIIDFVAQREADDEAFEALRDSFFLGSATQAQVNSEEFVTVVDETGRISFSAPRAWGESQSGPYELDGEVAGIEFSVAENVVDFQKSWSLPGAWVVVLDSLEGVEPDDALDTLKFDDVCEYDARYDFEGERFAGRYDFWVRCDDVSGSVYGVFALKPVDADQPLVIVHVIMPTEADLSAIDPILNTLTVLPAPVETAPSGESSAEPGAAEESGPTVTVVSPTLNVRGGPGTNYARVGSLDAGAIVSAIGQWNDCAWLQIEDVDGFQGWVSGDAKFTTLNGACSDLPEVDAPPAPAAGAAGSSSGSSAGSSSSASQGCMSFKNQVGIEVNITLTHSTGWNTTFTVGKGETGQRCGPPGRYTWTASTWDGRSLNDELEVGAGETYAVDLNPG